MCCMSLPTGENTCWLAPAATQLFAMLACPPARRGSDSLLLCWRCTCTHSSSVHCCSLWAPPLAPLSIAALVVESVECLLLATALGPVVAAAPLTIYNVLMLLFASTSCAQSSHSRFSRIRFWRNCCRSHRHVCARTTQTCHISRQSIKAIYTVAARLWSCLHNRLQLTTAES